MKFIELILTLYFIKVINIYYYWFKGETTQTDDSRRSRTSLTINRALLEQSLVEAKQRVAQLKRELDANYNLLTIIDKYYKKGDNSEASAVEV